MATSAAAHAARPTKRGAQGRGTAHRLKAHRLGQIQEQGAVQEPGALLGPAPRSKNRLRCGPVYTMLQKPETLNQNNASLQ